MALLEVRNLVKHFPLAGSGSVVRAVNDVSFTLEKGETLSLVGESGSGKTTVGRCVLGLIKPTGGEVLFRGQAMGGKRDVRSQGIRGRIQLVFQEAAESLDPRMRVWESIGEPLRVLQENRSDHDRRILEVGQRVGLTQAMLEQFPAELSIGAQQRVGIARAMVTSPDLIVLDEPTSALDPTARAEIIDLLIRLQKEFGTAYLFISHDLSTVRYVSHRVAVMYLGMIVEQGESETLFSEPRHPYTVGLISSVLLPNPKITRTASVKLEGEIPSPIDLPAGCYLAGRCPFADDRCRAEVPPAEAFGPTHLVHCFHHNEVEAMGDAFDYFAQFQDEAEKLLSVARKGGDHG